MKNNLLIIISLFTINLIASQNLKMNKGEKSEKAIKKHAEEWIKANQSTFDSWIK